MPELPEVTTTVNGLKETIVGKTIRDVWTDWPKIVKHPMFNNFRKQIIGKKITSVERVGKNILIHLSGGYTILVHMKMTGHFLVGPYIFNAKESTWQARDRGPLRDDPFNRFVHLVFKLSGETHLALSDARKFAKIKLFQTHLVREYKGLSTLGPDALSLAAKQFVAIIHSRPRGKIKQVLMNQSLIAGIGNIYADEGLWRAGIHPASRSSSLSDQDLRNLHKDLQTVLKTGIRLRGDSMSDYRNVHGLRGDFQNHHKVYRKTNTACGKRDGGTIKRMVIGGRSAHFCPVHQSLK